MKKMMLFIFMIALVALALPAVAMAAEPGSAEVATGSVGWDMAMKIVLPVLLVVSSIIANFFVIKPTDSPGLNFLKRIVNVMALNLSKNAGQ